MQPTTDSDRAAALDALRGVALFGVFLVNLTGFAHEGAMATQSQLLSLPTAGWDYALHELIQWLVADKANTLFAFLFGVGFSLQMQRTQARGANFEAIYLRRLFVLLVFGWAHLVFLWTWDILHLYALAGLALFALRGLPNRWLLIIGVPLALVGRHLTALGGGADHRFEEDAVVLVRQQLASAGHYLPLLRHFTSWLGAEYVGATEFPAWFLYALGRFMLGAWVGRGRWLTHPQEFLPFYRRWQPWLLRGGLLFSGLVMLLGEHWDAPFGLIDLLRLLATPVLAAGYAFTVVLWLQTPRGARWLAPFRYAGQMALTSYVSQTFVYGFVLFGIGPGLALGGRIGTVACTAIVIVAYAAQLALSRAWLRRFRYGPLEWAWRAATYGQWPAFRRITAPSNATR